MEHNDVYKKIQEFFGNLDNNFSLLEEPVDVPIQMAYFEVSSKVRGTVKERDILDRKDELFDPEISLPVKQSLLVEMAGIPNPEIYRTIEAYAKKPDILLKEWAQMALQENRLLLESHLLDSRQVFISTGLGGKGQKLRYFVVLISKNGQDLKPFQQKVVRDEMEYALRRYNGELEKMDFYDRYVTMRVVIPISSDLAQLFREGINECNQLGDFLSPDFMVTNVKELTPEEITEALASSNSISDDDFPPVD